MAGTEPYFYLRADERALARLGAPPGYALVLLAPLLAVLIVLLGLALGARALLPPLASAIPLGTLLGAWGALLLAAGLWAWRRAATTEYALTDERIYARVGRLITSVHFTTHDKVTDIRYRQGPLERAFGLASITFATAGGEVRVAGVRDALGLKATAQEARDAFVRRLLREAPAREEEPPEGSAPARASPPEEPAPRPATPPIVAPAWSGPRPDYLQEGDAPVWYEKPRPIAALGAMRSLLGIVPILFFSNLLEGPRRVFIPLVAIGFVLMFVSIRLMQLRRTEYVATTRRVYARAGVLGTTVNQLTYDKITDITFQQDFLGRILGYGSVTLQTAGSNQAPITMIGLATPLAAKETIERWREASLAEGA